jgi:hypothetical protein
VCKGSLRRDAGIHPDLIHLRPHPRPRVSYSRAGGRSRTAGLWETGRKKAYSRVRECEPLALNFVVRISSELPRRPLLGNPNEAPLAVRQLLPPLGGPTQGGTTPGAVFRAMIRAQGESVMEVTL